MAKITPETAAKRDIKALLASWAEANGMKVQVEARPQGAMAIGGVADWLVTMCVDGSTSMGVTLHVEMKAGKNKPSPLQIRYLTQKHSFGAEGWVLWGDDEAQKYAFFRRLAEMSKHLKLGGTPLEPLLIVTKQEARDYARSLRP